MPEPSTLLLFAASTLALLVVPGPSVVYVVARTLEHGRGAGLVSVLGIEAGALVHVAAATAGLTAVLASSELAFTAIRWAGAAYLVVLGVRSLRRRPSLHGEAAEATSASLLRLFRAGVLVDLLNPKTGIFFLAFLPQFVDPARGAAALQVAVLGVLFVALAALTDGTYALVAAALRARLRGARRGGGRLARASGGVYLGLGALTVLA